MGAQPQTDLAIAVAIAAAALILSPGLAVTAIIALPVLVLSLVTGRRSRRRGEIGRAHV